MSRLLFLVLLPILSCSMEDATRDHLTPFPSDQARLESRNGQPVYHIFWPIDNYDDNLHAKRDCSRLEIAIAAMKTKYRQGDKDFWLNKAIREALNDGSIVETLFVKGGRIVDDKGFFQDRALHFKLCPYCIK